MFEDGDDLVRILSLSSRGIVELNCLHSCRICIIHSFMHHAIRYMSSLILQNAPRYHRSISRDLRLLISTTDGQEGQQMSQTSRRVVPMGLLTTLPLLGKFTPSSAGASQNHETLSPAPVLTKPHGSLLPSSVSNIFFNTPAFPAPVATKPILTP